MTIINPEILGTSKEEFTYNEGCLSFDGGFFMNSRPKYVDIKYQDVDGEWQIRTLEGITAFCFLHEYDHLLGRTLIDIKADLVDKSAKVCNNDAKE